MIPSPPNYTIQHLIAINQAIGSGALTVEYDGRRVTYRSIEDLLKAKVTIESYLNSSSGKVVVRQHRIEPRSGF